MKVFPDSITAYEYQLLPVGNLTPNCITETEAELLLHLNQRRPGFCERRHHSVRLSQYAGIVRLGNRVLEVLPKVNKAQPDQECRAVLLRLLKAARAIPAFSEEHTNQRARHGSLLEVFINAFFDSVFDLVRGGLLRQYKSEAADLRYVRGRIWLQRQFTSNANRPDLIACQYDELTSDNIWNQTLKAALRKVKPWIRSQHLYRRWSELIIVFDEVSDLEPQLRSARYNRQSGRYKSAASWARLILEMLTPDLRAGHEEAPSLLFDMNKLFERAAATTLKRSSGVAGQGATVEEQDRSTHLSVSEAGGWNAFPLRPDIVVRHGKRILLVADAKWKLVDTDPRGFLTPSEADAYQLHAYATAFACDNVCLIYPWHDRLAQSHETAFLIDSKERIYRLSIVCMDVSCDGMPLRRGAAVFNALAL